MDHNDRQIEAADLVQQVHALCEERAYHRQILQRSKGGLQDQRCSALAAQRDFRGDGSAERMPVKDPAVAAGAPPNKPIPGHSERTSNLASRLAHACHLSSTEQETARVAGLLHDVGKMGIPTEILQKRGALTQEERALVNMHPEMGKKIVSGLGGLERTVPAVLWHHERWDGAGYPHGISGEEIPVLARIMSVVDSFDAMRRNRPYRISMSIQSALQEIHECAGGQFDPKIANTFVEMIDRDPALAA